jgi:hypothetical protein
MRRIENKLWIWLVPEEENRTPGPEWIRHGGKWIVFDTRERIEALAEGLGPFIDSGKIESAKYWKGDPSAVNVYSLDSGRKRTWEILKGMGAGNAKVWEYDYAWDKNLRAPFSFVYSWCSKFRTILKGYGIAGSFRLAREVLQETGDR